mmetsp:Transcript_88205/g.175196  ORF Transcript_88205/g.175196 Transcript_88205/m.175196 type:complete len:855 (-) Transcript_88205:175-2739(-)|eukprot:CAMPEP_0172692026 /NCGR_PEP_ID=MMETSP1074-20121228/24942_1 /TAXON_ID=2916 /ORGANISM="Ceratium fusus, Strain PA161109" /LENGTH=854 /DNA_ID=CAMNT_0013512153 /DNA_START=51 /DNA_END=2615 /DNA_ORIENTATION=-
MEELASRENIINCFKATDSDGDGCLDYTEFVALLCKLDPEQFSEENENADFLLQHIDKDGDGRISFHEFVAYLFGDQAPDAEAGIANPAAAALRMVSDAAAASNVQGFHDALQKWLCALENGYLNSLPQSFSLEALSVAGELAGFIESIMKASDATKKTTAAVLGGQLTDFAKATNCCEQLEDFVACPNADKTFSKGAKDFGVMLPTDGVGTGDFKLHLVFKLHWQSGTAASLLFNSGQNIGFDGGGNTIFREGGTWGRAKTFGPGLCADIWYDLVVTRQAGILSAEADGRAIFPPVLMPDRISFVQLRPWRNEISVQEFSLSFDPTVASDSSAAVMSGVATPAAEGTDLCGSEHDCIACPAKKDEPTGCDFGVGMSCDVGTGDFTLRFVFKLRWQSHTAASLLFSSGQNVGFDGKGNSIFLEGGSWGRAALQGPALPADEWHDLVAVRSEGLLSIKVGRKPLCAPIRMTEAISSVKVRPWRNQVRVKELSIQRGLIDFNPHGAAAAALLSSILVEIKASIDSNVEAWPEDQMDEARTTYTQEVEKICDVLVQVSSSAGPTWLKYALLEARQLGASDCLPCVWERVIDASELQVPPYWDLDLMQGTSAGKGLGLEPGDTTNLLARVELSEVEFAVFQELLDSTFQKKYTRDRRGGKVPDRLELAKGWRVQNWQNYCEYLGRQDSIRAKLTSLRAQDIPINGIEVLKTAGLLDSLGMPLADDLNEQWLFHGTSEGAAMGITEGDFLINLAGSNAGTLYGRGVYLAESCTKSDEYSQENEEGLRCLLVCRATLGNVLYNDQKKCDPAFIHSCVAGPYQALLGDREKIRGTFREIIVYDEDQVYPEFILLYRRAYSS